MKTENLTPWCNLFLNASKYKVTIYKSRHQVFIYGVFFSFIIASLIFILTLNLYLLASVSSVIFFILSVAMSPPKMPSPLFSQADIESLILTNKGLCQFSSSHHNDSVEEYILSPYSRSSFLGCWLLFSKVGSLNKLESKFIFKDSLSSKDYSRLRRVIMALRP